MQSLHRYSKTLSKMEVNKSCPQKHAVPVWLPDTLPGMAVVPIVYVYKPSPTELSHSPADRWHRAEPDQPPHICVSDNSSPGACHYSSPRMAQPALRYTNNTTAFYYYMLVFWLNPPAVYLRTNLTGIPVKTVYVLYGN